MEIMPDWWDAVQFRTLSGTHRSSKGRELKRVGKKRKSALGFSA